MAKSIYRGNASQFFVAGELCRRGYSAVITLGNTPNTDILCSDIEGTKFVHIQVKTYIPNKKTCSIGLKSEKYFGPNFFWVLGGIPNPNEETQFEYFIIPNSEMAKNVQEGHKNWMETPGKNGRAHVDSPMRILDIPPYKETYKGWDISKYKNAWHLIEDKLK